MIAGFIGGALAISLHDGAPASAPFRAVALKSAPAARGRPGARGPQGPRGPHGVPGPRGTSGTDGARGPDGASGAAGEQGERGARGERGFEGPSGPSGPATLPDVLDSGKTLRGTFWARQTAPGPGNPTDALVSFAVALPTRPAHWDYVDAGDTSTDCTGSNVAPTAPRGWLCVYETTYFNIQATPGFGSAEGGVGPGRFGFALQGGSFQSGDAYFIGTWAVTAP
jgi:hypothetical protein